MLSPQHRRNNGGVVFEEASWVPVVGDWLMLIEDREQLFPERVEVIDVVDADVDTWPLVIARGLSRSGDVAVPVIHWHSNAEARFRRAPGMLNSKDPVGMMAGKDDPVDWVPERGCLLVDSWNGGTYLVLYAESRWFKTRERCYVVMERTDEFLPRCVPWTANEVRRYEIQPF